MQNKHVFFYLIIGIFFLAPNVDAQKFNAFGSKFYTIESEHFRINFPKGYKYLAAKAGDILENLYTTYSEKYEVVLPSKTEVVIVDGDIPEGFAFPNFNHIVVGIHDFDFNLRSTHEWLKGVLSHEYAHAVSIWSSFKLPPWIVYNQVGFFVHPNNSTRTEAIHLLPNDILPQWFTEGIAQYEDTHHGTDSWDSHRDMILRSLTLSNKLLSMQHMEVFAGKGDDFEKTYNHGFSLVNYIVDNYGHDKIGALLRESGKTYHLTFGGVIKSVLGISSKQLYREWKLSLEKKYKKQIKALGTQVYGEKLNKDGFDNYWPRFSPDESKVYFTSNGKNDYSFRNLYSYSFSDTIKDDNRIKMEMGVNRFYSIHDSSGLIAFSSMKSKKSSLPPHLGGGKTYDAFIDTLPPEKKQFNPFKKKTEKQVTEKLSVYASAFSPKGDRLAMARRYKDRFFLCIADTSGDSINTIYPPKKTSDGYRIEYIYSLDWSPNGRHITLSYFDHINRKIGIYDTLTKSFSVLTGNDYNAREPRYSADGKQLYFSSNQTGIFNIYRYDFDHNKLERITNVSGGAFAPDVSNDGKKLVYTNYDADGYGIYYIDSITVVETIETDKVLAERQKVPIVKPSSSYTDQRPYSRLPRQFLAVPTLIGEQILTESENEFKGKTTLKAGAVFNLMDPLAFLNLGTSIGGYALFEPSKLFQLINLDRGIINPELNYDLGFFGSSRLLPLTINVEYLLRGIAGEDQFYDEIEAKQQTLGYSIRLHNFTTAILHEFNSHPSNWKGLQAIGGLNSYNVLMLSKELYGFDFKYFIAKGYRLGTLAGYKSQAIDSRRDISPRGLYAKLQYYFMRQLLIKEENSFRIEGGGLKENWDDYNYHQVSGNLKFGMSTPWHEKHDLHLDLHGMMIRMADKNETLPSHFLPAAWVPGYAYYYSKEEPKLKELYNEDGNLIGYDTTDTAMATVDTALVTGKTVLDGGISYRFPVLRNIDSKFWFIYLDQVYGAANFSGGAGFDYPMQLFDYERGRWIFSYGLELRLEAISFSTYPMAVSFRWDRGFDRPKPIGGDRFTFRLGFSFDNWELIDIPDYFIPSAAVK